MRMLVKNQKGVTMIEVLVTIAILAIVVTPCLSAFVMAQRGNVKAAETQAAYTAAANLMEELKGIQVPQDDTDDTWENAVATAMGNKPNDGIHVIYEKVTVEGETQIQYYRIWIYAGDGENQTYTTKDTTEVPDDYILKGVIAP